jgi:hypothetical protein
MLGDIDGGRSVLFRIRDIVGGQDTSERLVVI